MDEAVFVSSHRIPDGCLGFLGSHFRQFVESHGPPPPRKTHAAFASTDWYQRRTAQASNSTIGLRGLVTKLSACRLPYRLVPAFEIVVNRQGVSSNEDLISLLGSMERSLIAPNRKISLAPRSLTAATFIQTVRRSST